MLVKTQGGRRGKRDQICQWQQGSYISTVGMEAGMKDKQ